MAEVRVAEMFAGVGGFRLGLEGCAGLGVAPSGPFRTVWASQWEPPGTEAKQFAWRCYEARFGEGSCSNEDVAQVLDRACAGSGEVPDFDLLVGGFPCQDHSVARPLRDAKGLEGRKGVLWWEIVRMLGLKRPAYALFENVDRLLKGPGHQRGRDFAVALSCLASLGYSCQWRVVNAADYGMPQRRRRVFMWCERDDGRPAAALLDSGLMARALPASLGAVGRVAVPADPAEAASSFGLGAKASPFLGAGAMAGGEALTARPEALCDGPRLTLGSVLLPDPEVDPSLFIDPAKEAAWAECRAAKRVPRVSREGVPYTYSEGAMAWPDPLDRPARTILTSEGSASPSRTTHAVRGDSGRLRRLDPVELERLQGFPDGWTDTGMTARQRAFCMGNALCVGVVRRVGSELGRQARAAAAA